MRIHVLLKSLAALGSLCVMLAGGPAHAALTTITTTGTIDGGIDHSGVFGTPGTLLGGLSYSQAITVDASLYAFQGTTCSPGYPCNYGNGSLTGTATTTVTVGSVSQTFTWDLSQYNYGQTLLANNRTTLGPSSYINVDRLSQSQEGYTSDGTYLLVSGYAYSFLNPFGISLSFDQSAFYTIQLGDVRYTSFYMSGPTGVAYFQDLAPDTISINASSNVPEPATLALLALALAGAGLTQRRKRAP